MAPFDPILAEIADKMLSWPALLMWVGGLSGAAWLLSRKRWWLGLLPLPLALLFAASTLHDMREPGFAPAVRAELGYSYWVVNFVPLLAILAAVCVRKKPASPQGPMSLAPQDLSQDSAARTP